MRILSRHTEYSDSTGNQPAQLSPDTVIIVDSENLEMNEAFAKARGSTGEFISVIQSNKPNFFSVKILINHGKQKELFWLSNLAYSDGVFSGMIDNEPELVENIKEGQKVLVKKEEIFDWLYMQDGKMYGNYTLRVLLPKMSTEEADKMHALLAD